MIRILIHGLRDGTPTLLDGKWLAEYDPTRQGWTPDGRPMIAHIKVVDDPKDALAFPEAKDALELWRRADGLRRDGKPNRPLTAFTVEFQNDATPKETP